jgi:hypothetical protein
MIKVGDVFKTNKGEDCVVVEYVNYDNIIVEFCDEYKYNIKVKGCQLKNGNIKNPYHPLLFGVGYYGVGLHKSKAGSSSKDFPNLPAYSAWCNMLSRCYDKNYIGPHLYENSTVHEDWHCFQTFAEWYYKELSDLKWNGKSYLDKDILGNGEMYSDKSCCLVSPAINTIIAQVHGGKFLPGVSQSTNGLFRVIPGYECSDERFTLENDAHMAFVEAKSQKIKALANEHKEFLRPHVYEALMTKDFRYKFSPFFEKSETLTG